jgi:hypothetical protein
MRIPPPAVFVFAVWAAMSAAAVAFVLAFGVNFPLADEWGTLSLLAAPRPDAALLWERHNEHQLPLPRLTYWAAYRLSGDLRTGMLLSAVGWSLLAWLLIATAHTVRGRPAYADAYFPLALLGWGQYENLLMSYQVGFMCSTVLAGLVLRELVTSPVTPSRVARVGVFSTLLPMCGVHGLVFASPGMIWLTATGLDRRFRALCWSLALLTAAVASQYICGGLPPATMWQPPASALTFAVGLFGFGSIGYGPAAWEFRPWLAVVPAAAFVAAGWALLRAWRDRTADRLGVSAFVAAAIALAAVIAWGRGRYGVFAVFFPRYTVLSALLPIAIFFLWLKVGRPQPARWGPAALVAAALVLLPVNTYLGWQAGSRLRDIQQSAEADLVFGVPVEVVAERTNFLVFNDPAAWATLVEEYANRDLGRLRSVRHLPPYCVEQLTRKCVVPSREGGFALSLPKSRAVLAVRIRVSYRDRDPHRPARFSTTWRAEDGGPESTRDDWLFRCPTAAGDPTMVVWIDGPLREMRVIPDMDAPDGAVVTGVELLVP